MSLHKRKSAFTLVELLVVIGIIVVIIGMLAGGILMARGKAETARIGLDLQAIATALEAYKHDFRQYPLVPGAAPDGTAANPYGSQVLCAALLAPCDQAVDGADSFGFRARASGQGQAYGPYIKPDSFKVFNFGGGVASLAANTNQLIDKSTRPILYIPGTMSADITAANGYFAAAASARYNMNLDNIAAGDRGGMQSIAGDSNKNGRIDGTEKALGTSPYLLWSAGPDSSFGSTDDVTNFAR